MLDSGLTIDPGKAWIALVVICFLIVLAMYLWTIFLKS